MRLESTAASGESSICRVHSSAIGDDGDDGDDDDDDDEGASLRGTQQRGQTDVVSECRVRVLVGF